MNLNDEYVKWCKEYDKSQGEHRLKAELLAYNAFIAGFKVGAAPLNQEVQHGQQFAHGIYPCPKCGRGWINEVSAESCCQLT